MKKKINLQLFTIGFVSILLTVLFTALLCYNQFLEQVKSDLKNNTETIAESYRQHDEIDLTKFAQDDLRITLVGPDGTVSFDSFTNSPESMENHAERPEIKQALATGTGEALRMSDTIGSIFYYYAVTLSDGTVLRLSMEVDSVFSLFQQIFPSILLVVLLVLALCIFLSNRLTRNLLKPIETMAANINSEEWSIPYDELVPFAKIITKQRTQIHDQLISLEQEKNKTDLLIKSMSEGFLLLDSKCNIVMYNPSAIALLAAPNEDYRGKNILVLSRLEILTECIYTAQGGTTRTMDASHCGKQLQIFANPVMENEALIGVLCLILDVTEKKEIDRMKQEFTANVSHELKTPLTSISGYAELIETGIAKPEDIPHFASKIHHEAGRLLSLVGDIIKLSELEETEQENQGFQAVNLYETAQSCLERLTPSAEKRQVTLSLSGEDSYLSGDPDMLEELVYNLCDNAIRYNRPDGKVSICVTHTGQNTVLTVKDSGIGIPEQHQNRIFERFYRVDKSRSKETGGTGLGLAIVKHIAELHSGTIQLESSESIGTTITVLFHRIAPPETDSPA